MRHTSPSVGYCIYVRLIMSMSMGILESITDSAWDGLYLYRSNDLL